MLRPALPNVLTALICQAGVSPEEQLRSVLPSASSVQGLNQRSGVAFDTRQSPITLGRSAPPAVLLSSRPEKTINGRPPCNVRMPVVCQPLAIALITTFDGSMLRPVPNGRS